MTMNCTCGEYVERMVIILGPSWGNFEPNNPEMAVCKNCGSLPPKVPVEFNIEGKYFIFPALSINPEADRMVDGLVNDVIGIYKSRSLTRGVQEQCDEEEHF